MTKKVAVIDNGTGFTKLGYAGNDEPTYIIPSTYGDMGLRGASGPIAPESLGDLDFGIGYESSSRRGAVISKPIAHGIVEDWDKMERMWQHQIFKYLRVEPSEYGFVLTEPPANPPENRELTAEVFFETFGAKQLFIAVQGVLALTASWSSEKSQSLGLSNSLTGTVIDSGDGVTHVIPIVEGFVLSNCIRHIPLAGRDITEFVVKILREREPGMPLDGSVAIAQHIKEQHCYICKDIAEEFNKYDANPKKYITKHEEYTSTGTLVQVDVGPEKFLGPEIFFTPEIFDPKYTDSLPQLVYDIIVNCPIDAQTALFKNVVLSGGTTMFRRFDSRLQRDLSALVDIRIAAFRAQSKDKDRTINIPVNVISHERQRYAVWYGGSFFGASEQYDQVAITKKQYDEYGPSICRSNAMFR